MDDFADYVSGYDDETIQAFLYLKDMPEDHILNEVHDAPFYKIPIKARKEGYRLYLEYLVHLGKRYKDENI